MTRGAAERQHWAARIPLSAADPAFLVEYAVEATTETSTLQWPPGGKANAHTVVVL